MIADIYSHMLYQLSYAERQHRKQRNASFGYSAVTSLEDSCPPASIGASVLPQETSQARCKAC